MSTPYSGVDSTWTTTIPMVADGEFAQERVFSPMWRAQADRTAYLYRVLPRLYSYAFNTGGTVLWTYGNSFALENTEGVSAYVDVPNCAVGDKIKAQIFAVYIRGGSSLSTAFDAYILAKDTGGAYTAITGANWHAPSGVDSGTNNLERPLGLEGVWTVAAAGTTRIAFGLSASNWSSDTFKIKHAMTIVATRQAQ